ncbi:Putative quinoprotein amine dehydrogenase, beta chain [Septoria linicola]|uniref:Quinoprotein amine dehydrogenase, beta chain n=1 Tax=Septoria linicola TaxID=215465 RepID=A0A9Q9AND6_9PEZI|nr:Putative quinoprotein amine dehydrogenase, beta chain [Septoria linicola]
MRSYAIFTLITAALALPSKRDATPADLFPHPLIPNVAYVLENNPAGSNILSFHIGQDGTLSKPTRTSTGGKGALSYCQGMGCGNQGDPFPVDALGSQGAVHISGNTLFAVNAGSNTLSMFAINPLNPYKPKLLGTPVDTLGEFPISVDYSAKLRQACVLNGGTKAGVACFSVDLFHGLHAKGPLRALDKSYANETTPASGVIGTAAQVLFNPDSTALFVTVKGNGFFPPKKDGTLAAWPIKKGEVSTNTPVISQIDGVYMDFGFQFLTQNSIMLADAASGVSLLDVGSDLKATERVRTIIPGQLITCWTQYERSLNTLYAMDGARNLVYLLDPQTFAHFDNITVTTPPYSNASLPYAGVYDSAIQNGKMYSVAYTNGLLVFDLAQKKQVQYLDLTNYVERPHLQGMAVWP